MPHVTFAPLAILTSASAAMTAPTLAQTTVRNERVQFPRGATSTSVRGTIRGYQVVDYVVGARAGQALAVSLRTDNASTYFNVLPPRSEQAIFTGSISGNRFSGRLAATGDYRLRVYLMRNAARRAARADYNLSIAIVDRPAILPSKPIMGSGKPVSPGNMPAFCRGEAASHYRVRPAYVRTGRLQQDREGQAIEGTVDRGGDGIARFRCRFDPLGRFINLIPLPK